MLAIVTKMSLTQISTWFANARRRIKKDHRSHWTAEIDRGTAGGDDNCSDDVDMATRRHDSGLVSCNDVIDNDVIAADQSAVVPPGCHVDVITVDMATRRHDSGLVSGNDVIINVGKGGLT